MERFLLDRLGGSASPRDALGVPMHHAVPLTAALALAAASCARASAEEARANNADAGVTTTSAIASATRPPAPTTTAECPASMVLVEGEYCPEVEQRCVEWLDPPGTRYEHFRCKRYAQPATCHGSASTSASASTRRNAPRTTAISRETTCRGPRQPRSARLRGRASARPASGSSRAKGKRCAPIPTDGSATPRRATSTS